MDDEQKQQIEALSKKQMKKISGFFPLFLFLACSVFLISVFFMDIGTTYRDDYGRIHHDTSIFLNYILPSIMQCIVVFFMSGLKIVEPNEARLGLFFGVYVGKITESGFWFVNPFYATKKVTLKVQNFVVGPLKVNDKRGNPIEVGAIVVMRVTNPYAAAYEVENYVSYAEKQADSALRTISKKYPYDSEDEKTTSLRDSQDDVIKELEKGLQDRFGTAGLTVDEARISHLAYAPEIAQAMLQKQQAQALVEAREIIATGAVSIAKGIQDKLKEEKVAGFNDEMAADQINKMVLIMLSESNVAPVIDMGK